MSLNKAKTLFCIATIAIAVLLYAAGGTVYWMASVVVLGSALPGWELAQKTMLAQAYEEAATFLEVLQHAGEASQQPDQVLQDSPDLK